MAESSQLRLSLRLAAAVTRRTRQFTKRQDGSAAVEFAMVALPFFALIFAILETALIFFAGQTLQAAAGDAGRLIMTGQAQTANYSAADFKNQVCARIYGLFNCQTGMTVDVKTYSSFGSVDTTSPTKNGQFDSTKAGYSLGGPGCIQVVTLYYQWPVYVPLLGLNYLGTNSHLLQATAVFKNEPYGTVACS
jgi:Flp pilus assembly protein TadG